MEDEPSFQSRQVFFSHPAGSSAAGHRSHATASAPYSVNPVREVHRQPEQRLIHRFLYSETGREARELPSTARAGRRQELFASTGTALSNLEREEQQHVLEPAVTQSAVSASRFYASHPPSLERDDDYNLVRGFARSAMSPLSPSSYSPSFSPWSAYQYLPNYSPTAPNYYPTPPTNPGYTPTATAQDFAPTNPRYNPTSNTRYAPTTSAMRPLSRSAGDDWSQPHSRSTMDYFRLLSRASDTQHRRRMREDRDRFQSHRLTVARAGTEEARATAHRSRSREGGIACPSRPDAGISPCSFLRLGMAFEGVQSSQEEVPSPAKEWSVTVEVTQVSVDTGMLSGTITARNIPHQSGSVVTYFTGEVIDMLHYNFMSPEHETDECMDWNHWNQFSAFCAMSRGRLSALGDLTLQDVDSSGYVFMRWKERAFVSKLSSIRERGQHGSLTITGFYYVCLERATGKIQGSYCDPAKHLQGESTHFSQQLRLKPRSQKSSGYSFGTVSFS